MDSALLLGLEIDGDGAHPAAWRAAGHPPDALLTASRLAAVARRAEEAGFAFVTLDDDPDTHAAGPGSGVAGRFDPVTAAAYLSAVTTTLGLVPVVPTAGAEPFHVSNQLSSLDHGSRGRVGWLVRGGDAAAEAADVVDATRRLWDSWQDDAVIADEATGRFLDADRVHHVDFTGRDFAIRGPALMPRPPQGQVVVLAPAGALPADLVDVEVVTAPAEAAIHAAAGARRAPRVLAEIEVVLDTADATAVERLTALDRLAVWQPGERLRFAGPAGELVALLHRLAAHVDAVRLVPAVLDQDLPVLAAEVLPALGLPRPAPGATLRDRLGLPRPAGRYAS